MPSDHKFQIDLRGVIGVLSSSLYSGPRVFVRELLQNATDALRARRTLEPDCAAKITIEVTGRGADRTLVVTDTGVGLTEEEVHRFLATIGSSSKRSDLGATRDDFIGNFGIGLLSCFMAGDEIVMITRSAKADNAALEWRGKSDGTYALRTLAGDAFAVGTTVYLRAREESADLFELPRVRELLTYYGALLPFPIELRMEGGSSVVINDAPPWKETYASDALRRRAYLAWGQTKFGQKFFDAVDLRTEDGAIEGIAFVLPETPRLAAKGGHRIYLKGMLLTDKAEGLLPDWAFFLKLVANTTQLHPAASRESFHEDDALDAARESISAVLREYLRELAENDPDRLKRLITLHYLAIKALAVEDDEIFQLFIDFLPFETSLGTLTLKECRERQDDVRYVKSRDQFRQVAQIMAAQGVCVVDAGYAYDAPLLDKYAALHPELDLHPVEPSDLTHDLDPLSPEERKQTAALIAAADAALRPFRCSAQVRKFRPAELPTLYSIDSASEFRRTAERTKESTGGMWSDILDGVLAGSSASGQSELCLNYTNPLVQKLATVSDPAVVRRAIEMLYVQALLLGHHPLNRDEMRLLSNGLIDLIERAL